MNQQDKNKETAIKFYDLMFNQNNPKLAVENYVGETYTQHNPMVEDGKDAFISYFEEMAKECPDKEVRIHKVIAEDDFVVLHCQQFWPGQDNWAGIDIFKFDQNGKIIEHWDVLQTIPNQAKNSNSMF